MNVCIVGFGELGNKYYKLLENKINVIYIVEKKKINLIKKKIKIFNDISELPREIKYDLIIICVSQVNKFDIFKKISNLSVKKILVEKPISNSIKEFKLISNLIKRCKFEVYTNYIRQFIDEFNDIKKIISSKQLGKPKLATFYYSKGIFYNGVHFIDFAINIFGFPDQIKIISKKKSVEKKHDYLIDFYFQFQNYKVYFLSFETKNVASSNLEIILENGKVEITSNRLLKIYKIKKNTIIKNINQFSLIKSCRIDYEKSFKKLIILLHNSNNLNKKNTFKGFRTNDDRIYKVIEKLI